VNEQNNLPEAQLFSGARRVPFLGERPCLVLGGAVCTKLQLVGKTGPGIPGKASAGRRARGGRGAFMVVIAEIPLASLGFGERGRKPPRRRGFYIDERYFGALGWPQVRSDSARPKKFLISAKRVRRVLFFGWTIPFFRSRCRSA